MPSEALRILTANDVRSLLSGKERDIVDIVRRAYLAHAAGNTILPHSVFLNLPGNAANRIIALPAYVGENVKAAGIKWVSSIPANTERGLARASGVVLLNSVRTGTVEAILEGSIINAWRTAASATLAVSYLHPSNVSLNLGLIGCGNINGEIVRFLNLFLPLNTQVALYDVCENNARRFIERWSSKLGNVEFRIMRDLGDVLHGANVVSFATTAITPHVLDLSPCRNEVTILHVSLRDLAPEVIRTCDNVVDDVDHVCQARTSLHLTEQLSGDRSFIRCTLADVINGITPPRATPSGITVFSPFGLGVLDVAVAHFILKWASELDLGYVIPTFNDERQPDNTI